MWQSKASDELSPEYLDPSDSSDIKEPSLNDFKKFQWEKPTNVSLYCVYVHNRDHYKVDIDPVTWASKRWGFSIDYDKQHAAKGIYFRSIKAAKAYVDMHPSMFFMSKKKKVYYREWYEKYYWIKQQQMSVSKDDLDSVLHPNDDTLWFKYNDNWSLEIYLLSKLIEQNEKSIWNKWSKWSEQETTSEKKEVKVWSNTSKRLKSKKSKRAD